MATQSRARRPARPTVPESHSPVAADGNGRTWPEYVCFLTDEVLVLVGSGDSAGTSLVAGIERGAELLALDVRRMPLRGTNGSGMNREDLLLLRLPAEFAEDSSATLELEVGGRKVRLGQPELVSLTVELRTLLREHVAGLDPEYRHKVLHFLATSTGLPEDDGRAVRLAKTLHQAREALRERQPQCAILREQPRCVHVESVLAVDDRSFLVRGWARDAEAPFTRLTAVSPEGCRAELLGSAYTYPRPDLDKFYGDTAAGVAGSKPGFIAHFTLPAPSRLSDGWVFEIENEAGSSAECKGPRVIRDLAQVRDAVLGELAHDRLPRRELTRDHVHPAVQRLLERAKETVRVAEVAQFGAPVSSPELTVIVPLYRRIDFLEHQLAQFVQDPSMRQADLVYVLDSPEMTDATYDLAQRLYQLYRVPLRVVALEKNVGYALANNAAAAFARGRLLVLLNSDILPDRPGWFPAMARFYDSTPGIGTLGPKLLFEDDSLQHAGLFFRRLPHLGIWCNDHYFKGLHRDFPAANVTRPVPAVTGACVMIDRALFNDLGGLHCVYVQGDFEDSDLGLRLIESGRENWYLPEVELYHLEGQSYSQGLRELTGRYNCWLQTHRWEKTIEAVTARYGGTAEDGAVPTRR